MVAPGTPHNPPGTPQKRRRLSESDLRQAAARPGGGPALGPVVAEGSFYTLHRTGRGTVMRVAKRQGDASAEAAILAAMRHHGVNAMLGCSYVDGVVHFEMEYCERGSLSEILQEVEVNQEDCKNLEAEGFDQSLIKSANKSLIRNSPIGTPNRNIHSRNKRSEGGRSASNVLKEAIDMEVSRCIAEAVAEPDFLSIDPFTDEVSDVLNSSRISYGEAAAAPSEHPLDAPGSPCRDRRILKIMLDVSEALAFVHGQQVIHMDVKPANVLLGPLGYQLCDFNIARTGIGPIDLDGDPRYLAPEVLNNVGFYVSDVFALGLIYFALINGNPKISDHADLSFDRTEKDCTVQPSCASGGCQYPEALGYMRLPTSGPLYDRIRHNDLRGFRTDAIARRMLERDPLRRISSVELYEYFHGVFHT